MRHFAVVGYPLGHSLSPVLHNHLFSVLGLEARYDLRETPPGQLETVVRQLHNGELVGINVTLPHKTAILPYLNTISSEAGPVGAVNCVAVEDGRLTGYNTDVPGLRQALRNGGFAAKGCRALLLGAGGAARAAVIALAQEEANHLTVAVLPTEALDAFTASFEGKMGSMLLATAQLGPELDTSSYDLIIHATPVGMWPNTEKAVLEAHQFHEGQTVVDMVYHPEMTLLLQRAAARECPVIPGMDMFIAQGLISLKHWFPDEIYGGADDLNPKIDPAALKRFLLETLDLQNRPAPPTLSKGPRA
ncbi:Shikimate dehydrogenase (NADP(+)) [subsurface metagenome]